MDDIIKYLSAQDEEYFAERETTKSKVLSDDTILADLRDEHYNLVPSRAYSKDRFREFNTRQWYSYAEATKE